MQGQIAEGITLARQGLNAAKETSLRLHTSQLSMMLAETLITAGRNQEAIEVLDEGIRRFEQYATCCAPPTCGRSKETLCSL